MGIEVFPAAGASDPPDHTASWYQISYPGGTATGVNTSASTLGASPVTTTVTNDSSIGMNYATAAATINAQAGVRASNWLFRMVGKSTHRIRFKFGSVADCRLLIGVAGSGTVIPIASGSDAIPSNCIFLRFSNGSGSAGDTTLQILTSASGTSLVTDTGIVPVSGDMYDVLMTHDSASRTVSFTFQKVTTGFSGGVPVGSPVSKAVSGNSVFGDSSVQAALFVGQIEALTTTAVNWSLYRALAVAQVGGFTV